MPQPEPTDTSILIDSDLLELLIEEHDRETLPRLRRMWDYYRNDPGEEARGGAQRQGLPDRLTQHEHADVIGDTPAREVVVENDIAWRVHTLVDFMFSKPVVIQSRVEDDRRASQIEAFLDEVIKSNGGISFYQNLALLGSIYGHVDILVRVMNDQVALELIDAPRAIPLLNPNDFRELDAYITHYPQQTHELETGSFLTRVRDRMRGRISSARRVVIERTELWTTEGHQVLISQPTAFGQRRNVVQSESNRLGGIPVVHIQNLAQPFFYPGLSEVEPLIPLQDELNTRMSDRANRVTLQCFKMYLGKGIEGFTDRQIGPGQMWSTDNLEASIEAFGGDGPNPSEDIHIEQVREAMDKVSSVSPLATGLVRDRVGNLSSENALRIVMLGLLARTEKKRVTYGAGLERLCELILHAADVYGFLPNRPEERQVRLNWPNPVPDNESTRLANAQQKLEIGVPARQVLAELGYADCPSH